MNNKRYCYVILNGTELWGDETPHTMEAWKNIFENRKIEVQELTPVLENSKPPTHRNS